MEGIMHDTTHRGARVKEFAVLEVPITTGRSCMRFGDVTFRDWLTRPALDADDTGGAIAATGRFLAELMPYFVTEATTTREALRLYFAERPGVLRAALFGMAS
jgi:hypothetical protein